MLESTLQNGQESLPISPITGTPTYNRRRSLNYWHQRTQKKAKTIDYGRLSLRGIGGSTKCEKELLEKLGNAIRTGDLHHIQNIFDSNKLSNVISLGFEIKINVYKVNQLYRENGGWNSIERQSATMEVSPLQLAVILKKEGIVKLMLELVSDKETNKLIVNYKATVKFEEEFSNYRGIDRMLDGSSAFHLAARFDAESLKILIDHIKDIGIIKDYIIMTGQGGQSGYSALHHAACNTDTDSLR